MYEHISPAARIPKPTLWLSVRFGAKPADAYTRMAMKAYDRTSYDLFAALMDLADGRDSHATIVVAVR